MEYRMDILVDLIANAISVQVAVAELAWAGHHSWSVGNIQRGIVHFSCTIRLLSSGYKVDSGNKVQS